MIWLDITDPKYVLFFKNLIPLLKTLDKVLITTRKGAGYEECARLLELFGIESIALGGYGGAGRLEKLQARLRRQEAFLELFAKVGLPKLFITGVSVEGTHTAYGLGIPNIQFSDTPLIHHQLENLPQNLSIIAKLTLPLSSLIFHPFLVPQACFKALGVEEENIISYDFIDVALWLKDLRAGEDFRARYNLDKSKPTILVREEEYKAHYVKQKLPIIYESIPLLAQCECNIVIMPRYESDYLKEAFGGLDNVKILDDKLAPQDFYPFIDILIGGGGTMNLESCYLGIPTISTRSLFLFHDRYLIDNGLMQHCKEAKEVLSLVQKWLKNREGRVGQRKDNRAFFEKSPANFDEILRVIKQRFYPQASL